MAQRLRVLKILWLGLCGSLVLYVVVIVQLHAMAHAPGPPGTDPNTLFVALAVCATGAAFASFVVPALLLKTALRKLDVSRFDALSTRALDLYRQPFIIGMALSESVALFGFMLGFLGYHSTEVAPFFIASALLMLVRYPSESRVKAALDKAR